MNRRTFFNVYVGLHGSGWLYILVVPLRRYLWLRAPRARSTNLEQGPGLRRGVRAGSLNAPTPIREKNHGRKREKCRCAKTNTSIHGNVYWYIVFFCLSNIWYPSVTHQILLSCRALDRADTSRETVSLYRESVWVVNVEGHAVHCRKASTTITIRVIKRQHRIIQHKVRIFMRLFQWSDADVLKHFLVEVYTSEYLFPRFSYVGNACEWSTFNVILHIIGR